MKEKKLYYHRTDRGAEYFCTRKIKGTNEGNMRAAIVRLDGEPVMYIKKKKCGRCTDLLAENKRLKVEYAELVQMMNIVKESLFKELAKNRLLNADLEAAISLLKDSGLETS